MFKRLIPVTVLLFFLFSCQQNVEVQNLKKDDQANKLNKTSLSGNSSQIGAEPPPSYYYPIGGGQGYGHMIYKSNATYIVTRSTPIDQFINWLKNKNAVIFIENDVILDLSDPNYRDINIAEGVTLASDRGQWISGGVPESVTKISLRRPQPGYYSKGALIKTSDISLQYELFRIENKNVRITGLRLQGPSQDTTKYLNSDGKYLGVTGILIYNANNCKVDNCELFGWTGEAVGINTSSFSYVNNNYIHHNQMTGLGYGVCVAGDGDADAHIMANIFNYNRHSIAGGGKNPFIQPSYEAAYNIIESEATSHSFDMHGTYHYESGSSSSNYKIWAGNNLQIHHNTFRNSECYCIGIRGVPLDKAEIYNNKFETKNYVEQAVRQYYTDNGNSPDIWNYVQYGNLSVFNNETISNKEGWYISFTTNFDNNLKSNDFYRVFTPTGSNKQPSDINEVRCGEFSFFYHSGKVNYEQKHFPGVDILYGSGTNWYMTSLNAAYGNLHPEFDWINDEYLKVDELYFGNFINDGDDINDVFRGDGSHWYILRDPIKDRSHASWQKYGSSQFKVKDLRFGDFDGDGDIDIFRADTVWSVAKTHYPILDERNWDNNETGWYCMWDNNEHNEQPLVNSDLGFGDFNKDGYTDIFYGDGTHWWIYWNNQDGTLTKEQYAESGYKASSLYFDDFDGDGATDIFIASPTFGWNIARPYLNQGWYKIKDEYNFTTSDLKFGDFDGNGLCDVLVQY